MNKVFLLSAAALAAYAGFGVGSGTFPKPSRLASREEAVAITQNKPFTIVLIGQNDGPWVVRALASIFEQDHENYRLVFVDDGSRDETFSKVSEFVVENAQEHRVILMKNEMPIGFEASLCRALEQCGDREIVLPMNAKDWLAEPSVLTRLNASFQTDVRYVIGSSIGYPSYEYEPKGIYCAYGALFKQVQTGDYPKALANLAGKKSKTLPDLLLFSNETLKN